MGEASKLLSGLFLTAFFAVNSYAAADNIIHDTEYYISWKPRTVSNGPKMTKSLMQSSKHSVKIMVVNHLILSTF